MTIEIYLLILAVLTGLTIGGMIVDNILILLGGIPGMIWLLLGFLTPLGGFKDTKFPATATRMGDEIFIQSKAKSMVETNLKYLDNPVVIVETRAYTVWGYEIGNSPSYKIELAESEKAQ